MNNEQANSNRVNEAVRSRLVRLAHVSVDTTHLKHRLNDTLDNEKAAAALTAKRRRAATVLAASIGLILTILLVFNASAQPPEMDARWAVDIHRRFLSGSDNDTKPADSIEHANHIIATQWPHASSLPKVSSVSVKGVCVHEVENVPVSCLHAIYNDQSVTLLVADTKAMRPPSTDLSIDSAPVAGEGFNTVFGERDGKCLCMVSKLPKATLVALMDNVGE